MYQNALHFKPVLLYNNYSFLYMLLLHIDNVCYTSVLKDLIVLKVDRWQL